MSPKEESKQWYVIQAMHGKAERAKSLFSDLGIDSFVPMKLVLDGKKRKGAEKLVPVFNHLIFADTTLSKIMEIREANSYIYYRADITDNNKPMIVPREAMEYFIDFIESGGEDGYKEIEYIDVNSFDIKKGELVRILAGSFKGKEGTLVKVKGKHLKQIVVAISGILSIEIKHPNPSRIVERI